MESNFYTEENLKTISIRTLRMLTVMGYHCGLDNTTIELILKIIAEKEAENGTKERRQNNKET